MSPGACRPARAPAYPGADNPAARDAVERQALRCEGVDALTARFVARVNMDLRLAGRQLADGTITPSRYLVVLADRRVKIEKFLADPAYRRAYAQGDDDRDLVPNRFDRCRRTPPGATTDAAGCEYDCENLAASRSRRVTAEQCRAHATPPGEVEQVRRIFNTKVPFNPACDGAPPPSATSPLGWTPVVLETGPVPPTSTFTVRGLKLFAVRASSAPPSCEVFYEFDLRFLDAAGVKATGMLFSVGEDSSRGHPDIVAFTLRTVREVFTPAGPGPSFATVTGNFLPLTPGRALARDGFSANPQVTWRVRAVNGLGATAGWSEFRKHVQGSDLTP